MKRWTKLRQKIHKNIELSCSLLSSLSSRLYPQPQGEGTVDGNKWHIVSWKQDNIFLRYESLQASEGQWLSWCSYLIFLFKYSDTPHDLKYNQLSTHHRPRALVVDIGCRPIRGHHCQPPALLVSSLWLGSPTLQPTCLLQNQLRLGNVYKMYQTCSPQSTPHSCRCAFQLPLRAGPICMYLWWCAEQQNHTYTNQSFSALCQR